MDQGAADRGLSDRSLDRGVSSVQFLLASALSLIVFLAFANLVAVQYGRGAIRSALDQGARSGAVVGSTQLCEATARDILSQLLGGLMGDSVSVVCQIHDGLMTASGSAVFESWTPLSGDFEISVSGGAAMEHGR